MLIILSGKHICKTHLQNTFAKHICETHLRNTFASHICVPPAIRLLTISLTIMFKIIVVLITVVTGMMLSRELVSMSMVLLGLKP